MLKKLTAMAIGLTCLGLLPIHAFADEHMKPFILAETSTNPLADVIANASQKLTNGGFEIVGTYAPYPDSKILIVTSPALKSHAAQSEFGAYGAAQRIAATMINDQVQLSYTNPSYMAAAYRMDTDMADIKATLEGALGNQGEFGSEDGMTAKQLRNYHYMFLMPYFDDPNRLGQAKSHQDMVQRVETNLAQNVGGLSQIYRIDIPGKDETVFGIAMKGEGEEGQIQDDAWIMSEIDFKDIRSTAHLPNEIVVSGKYAWALSQRFRIAINFPDLSMAGDNSFMNIMATPVAVQKAQTLAAGGTYKGDGTYAD